MSLGLRGPARPTLGADIAGRLVAIGDGVTQFQTGDAVYGDLSASDLGGFAEYVCVQEQALAPKPPSLSFVQAAAVPMAAVTALQGLPGQPWQERLCSSMVPRVASAPSRCSWRRRWGCM